MAICSRWLFSIIFLLNAAIFVHSMKKEGENVETGDEEGYLAEAIPPPPQKHKERENWFANSEHSPRKTESENSGKKDENEQKFFEQYELPKNAAEIKKAKFGAFDEEDKMLVSQENFLDNEEFGEIGESFDIFGEDKTTSPNKDQEGGSAGKLRLPPAGHFLTYEGFGTEKTAKHFRAESSPPYAESPSISSGGSSPARSASFRLLSPPQGSSSALISEDSQRGKAASFSTKVNLDDTFSPMQLASAGAQSAKGMGKERSGSRFSFKKHRRAQSAAISGSSSSAGTEGHEQSPKGTIPREILYESLPKNKEEISQYIANGYGLPAKNTLQLAVPRMEEMDEPIGNFYPMAMGQLRKDSTQTEMSKLYGMANKKWNEELAKLLTKFRKQSGTKKLLDDVFDKNDQLISRTQLLANAFKASFNGWKNKVNPDSTDVIEAMVTATNLEKAKMDWHQLEGHSDWKNEISGNYRTLLLALGRNRPSNVPPIVGEQVEKMENQHFVQSLIDYTNALGDRTKESQNQLEIKEMAVINTLTKQNISKLREIFHKYWVQMRMPFFMKIMELRANWKTSYFLQTVEAIAVDVGQGRAYFFARLLNEKIIKIINSRLLPTDDAHSDVLRILLSRAQIDLPEILTAYEELFKEKFGKILAGKKAKGDKKMELYHQIVEKPWN